MDTVIILPVCYFGWVCFEKHEGDANKIDGFLRVSFIMEKMLRKTLARPKVYSRSLATEVVVVTTNDVRKPDACVFVVTT